MIVSSSVKVTQISVCGSMQKSTVLFSTQQLASIRLSPDYTVQQLPYNHDAKDRERALSEPWSPAVKMPLPDSDSEDEWEEGSSDADLFASSRNIYSSTSRTTSPRGAQSACAVRSHNLAEKINALDLKAKECSLARKLTATDNKASQEFTLVHLQDSRFNAREAAKLEEIFQAKVRRVYEARRQDGLNKARIEKEHRERLAREAEEAARRAEEIARRQGMERQRREQEKREREQRAAEGYRGYINCAILCAMRSRSPKKRS